MPLQQSAVDDLLAGGLGAHPQVLADQHGGGSGSGCDECPPRVDGMMIKVGRRTTYTIALGRDRLLLSCLPLAPPCLDDIVYPVHDILSLPTLLLGLVLCNLANHIGNSPRGELRQRAQAILGNLRRLIGS